LSASNFAKWHGIERSEIPWGPTIDEDKCVGCGLCVVTCSEKRNVFGFDEKEKKAVVVNPDNCMVGCNNCQVACLWNAISFPSVAGVKDAVRKLMDEGQIKKELELKLGAGYQAITKS
jgi:NAD-dependent dihydropyrimidine dehydrogenase PreA subunit